MKIDIHKDVVLSISCLLFVGAANMYAEQQSTNWNQAIASESIVSLDESQFQSKYNKIIDLDDFEIKLEIIPMQIHIKEMIESREKFDPMVMDLSQSHHVVLTIIDKETCAKISDVKVKLKFTMSDTLSQTKVLYWMSKMKYFGEDFDLSQPGQYQVSCQFKIQDKISNAGFFININNGKM